MEIKIIGNGKELKNRNGEGVGLHAGVKLGREVS